MGAPYNKRTPLSASTTAAAAEAPSDKGLRCHISVTNRSAEPRKARVHIGTSPTAGTGDWLEYSADVLQGVGLIRGPFVLMPNDRIYVWVDGDLCNVVAMGEIDLV